MLPSQSPPTEGTHPSPPPKQRTQTKNQSINQSIKQTSKRVFDVPSLFPRQVRLFRVFVPPFFPWFPPCGWHACASMCLPRAPRALRQAAADLGPLQERGGRGAGRRQRVAPGAGAGGVAPGAQGASGSAPGPGGTLKELQTKTHRNIYVASAMFVIMHRNMYI